MKYYVQFGILSWNNMIFGDTMKNIRNNLEDFFYTMNIQYKNEDNGYYSFILPDGSQHIAHINYLN